ncbi:hypothetical protein B7P43_G13063, partial [Cryptotermes secundus]
CIKFCQKLWDTQAKTIRKIQQAIGDDAMGVTQIKEWFNRFKHGRMSADSEQRSGRPSTSRNADVIEKVRTLIMEDRRLAIREVADGVGISRGSANTILTEDLGMRRVAAKFVPKMLSPEQQHLRLEFFRLPGCQTANKEYCQEALCHLRDAVRRKRLELWDARNWQLHHGNAPHLIQGFLAKHGIPQTEDTAKGCRFDGREDIIQNATAQLHAIPKGAFQNCFQRWKDRWAKCVESQGAYFEGD